MLIYILTYVYISIYISIYIYYYRKILSVFDVNIFGISYSETLPKLVFQLGYRVFQFL